MEVIPILHRYVEAHNKGCDYLLNTNRRKLLTLFIIFLGLF